MEKKYIEKTNLFMCDFLTDKIIPNKCHKLIFKYSRLFCDVERFKEDSKEEMSKKGMGTIYINDCDNIITMPNKCYKRKVWTSYYNKYHNKLDKIVTNSLKKYKKCIIIDFHSYSDEMVKKLFNIDHNTDICIGVDKNYTDEKLLNFTIKHFEKYGYTVDINKPYSGTIIPNKYYNKKERNLLSIMLEINKKIYLYNKKDFVKLKRCIEDYHRKIQNL